MREQLGFGATEVEVPVPLEAIELPPPRVEPPRSLSHLFRLDPYERVSHALGRGYRDVVRGFRGRIEHPPDLVAHPGDEREVEMVLAWCAEQRLAAIPYGGGTSVVGGVEPRVGDAYAGVVTIDLGRLDRVLEVDDVSRAARIQAGAQGPALEDQLREHGLTLRHFPQSFEFSTLGGWIATRAGGHFATLYTHIDDLVESVRAITPRGVWESRRLPGSGAGPSPDRLLLGSEGILGVITEAWVRVRERPRWKLSVGVAFDSFARGADAVRELAQSDLNPANCRLLDPAESELTHAGPPGKALLVLGFESAHHPVEEPMRIALEAARDHGGEPGGGEGQGGPGRPCRRLAARLPCRPVPARHPGRGRCPLGHVRDGRSPGIASRSSTHGSWRRRGGRSPRPAARRRTAPARPGCPAASRTSIPMARRPTTRCSVPARRGGEVEQWDEVKAAVSDTVIDAGGTITHHHAVGRDHRPWYDRQRPEPFAEALRAAKRAVDPAGVLNPGVLVDP